MKPRRNKVAIMLRVDAVLKKELENLAQEDDRSINKTVERILRDRVKQTKAKELQEAK